MIVPRDRVLRLSGGILHVIPVLPDSHDASIDNMIGTVSELFKRLFSRILLHSETGLAPVIFHQCERSVILASSQE